jgi:hypothetical protein
MKVHYTKIIKTIHVLTELYNNKNKSNLVKLEFIRRYHCPISAKDYYSNNFMLTKITENNTIEKQEVINFKTLTLAYNYITALVNN